VNLKICTTCFALALHSLCKIFYNKKECGIATRSSQRAQGLKKQWGLAGAYQNEEQAARAHDSAALKYWGPGAFINFPVKSCPLNAPVFFECSNILL
jgi:hypothetical protein